MSYGNPYQPANYVPAEKPVKGTLKLQFGEMFQFPFSNPNWVMNTLMCSLCQLVACVIPVVPQLVLHGYQWELLEALHLRKTRSYVDFDFNRIMPYLTRGIWPFLATLVATFVVMALMAPVIIIFAVILFIVMSSLGNDADVLLFLLVVFGSFFLGLLLGIVMNIVMIPLALRAALCQDFGLTFEFKWVRSFIGLMWKEIILGTIVLAVSAIGISFVGFLLCFIGTIPAGVIVSFMSLHFIWQLYEIFLDRGGEPIPLKPQMA